MATTTAHSPARTFRSRLSGRVSGLGLLDFLARADARYRARRQLRDLDDHLLRDIGVSRAEIDAEIARSFPW